MSPGTKTAISVLQDISNWSPVVPMIIGIVRFRNYSKGLRAIVALTIISLVADFIGGFSTRENPFGPYVLRVYSLCEFSLITLFFIGEISRPVFKRLLIGMIFIFLGVEILDYSIQGDLVWDNLSLAVESVLLMIYSLSTLYFIMRDMIYPRILDTPQFWIISAILVYFGGSIFVFAASNYAIGAEARKYIWSMHGLIHIAFNILIAIGLWKVKPVSR